MRLDWTLDEISSAIGAAWQSPRAPRVVELAVTLLIVLQAWALWQDTKPVPAPDSDPPGVTPPRPRFGTSELSQLLAAHLFGASSPETAAAPALAPAAFKLVGLYVPDGESLALSGTDAPIETDVVSDSAGESGVTAPLAFTRTFFGDRTIVSVLPGAIAWLSVAGAPGQRVQVGDGIGGGRVREISPEGVTLELGGRAVRVSFPENPFLAMFRGESNTALVVTDPNAVPAELVGAALRFQPELAGAALSGFRVYPGGDVASFIRAGLHAGDVVDRINGREVSLPRDVIPLLLALREAKPIPIRLRRGRQILELELFGRPAQAATPRTSSPGVLRHD
jgi:hypothetical protein